MTIYVCQELEQNRAPLQQKRDGGGDPNLCGGLWGAPPTGAGSTGGGDRRKSHGTSLFTETVSPCRARGIFVTLHPEMEMFKVEIISQNI